MAKSRFPLTTIVVTFFAGIVSAPYVKPLFRAAVKATVVAGIRAKQVAATTAEELQDIAAEAGGVKAP